MMRSRNEPRATLGARRTGSLRPELVRRVSRRGGIRVHHSASVSYGRLQAGSIGTRRGTPSVTTAGKHENYCQQQDRLHCHSIRGQVGFRGLNH